MAEQNPLAPPSPYTIATPPEYTAYQPTEAELADLLAGRKAKGELSNLEKQMQAVKTLRDMPTPQGRSYGSVYQAANPLEFLGAAMQGLGGERQMSGMQDQAAALRGEMAQGAQAQEASKRAEQAALMQARRDEAAAKAQTTANRDQWAEAQRAAREDRANAIKAANALQDDLEEKEKATLYDGLNSAAQKDLTDMRKGKLALNKVAKSASKLDDADFKKMADQSQFFRQMLEKVLPSDFENYMTSRRMNISPQLKDYLAQVQKFSAGVRHKLFGSALTVSEQKLSDQFLPSAKGITVADQLQRIKMYDDQYNETAESYQIFNDRRDYFKGVDPFPGTAVDDVRERSEAVRTGASNDFLNINFDDPAVADALSDEEIDRLFMEQGGKAQ